MAASSGLRVIDASGSPANRPQLLQLSFDDTALVAMMNLPMVGGAQARRVLDAVFPASGKWDDVMDFTVGQPVSRHELRVSAA
nr:hypothetical protein [Bradyrhizobium lablabi]